MVTVVTKDMMGHSHGKGHLIWERQMDIVGQLTLKRSISQGCYELEDLLKHRKGTLESNVCGRDRAGFGLMGLDGDKTGDGPEDDARGVQKRLSTLLTTVGGELEMDKWSSGLQLELPLLATVQHSGCNRAVTSDRLMLLNNC